jgi:hypothetical protein
MKIACWSGPRNISTALMRSWSSRDDTFVSDEPFYAYYLKETGVKHPMYKEIINQYPNSFESVLKFINTEIPRSKKVWYQKHMAHHFLELKDLKWLDSFYNCFLIRHPKQVIPSYLKINKLYNVEELGYKQQYEMINYLIKNNQRFLVINSNTLLKNPERILKKWCEEIDIDYDSKMLKWKKGKHSSDGIWYKHWYDSVIKTENFSDKFTKKDTVIEQEFSKIYNDALYYYEKINYFSIK